MVSLPSDAPFTPEQIGWLNGYLAARMQTQGTPSSSSTLPPTESSPAGVPATILWGSQTGTCETLAKKAAKSLTTNGHQITVLDMADTEPDHLLKAENLLIITSTYGDGEPPDNAQALHETLHSDSAPVLEKTNFTVLGLGDSEYPDFNQCAKEFDLILEKLGAKRLSPLIQSDVDYDDPFDQWLNQTTEALAK